MQDCIVEQPELCAVADIASPKVESADNIVRLARYRDQDIIETPHDLYIPPEALKVILEAFEGPLDLLLYLIRKSKSDILDIPIAQVTKQYVEYIDLMHSLEISLAADYLVMAAMLAEIKSRLLLPRVVNEEGEEEDPRAELVRRLQEYEQFKLAAEQLQALPHFGQDFFAGKAEAPEFDGEPPLAEMLLPDLIMAMRDVLRRADLNASHNVLKEPISIRERMTNILGLCGEGRHVSFPNCFTLEEGRMGVVVTFIAMLELLRQDLIEIVQAETFAPIYIKAKMV